VLTVDGRGGRVTSYCFLGLWAKQIAGGGGGGGPERHGVATIPGDNIFVASVGGVGVQGRRADVNQSLSRVPPFIPTTPPPTASAIDVTSTCPLLYYYIPATTIILLLSSYSCCYFRRDFEKR